MHKLKRKKNSIALDYTHKYISFTHIRVASLTEKKLVVIIRLSIYIHHIHNKA